jgi:hypothetical protein
MAAQIEYISFNNDKNIDELLYNTDQFKLRLKGLETELKFYKFLIEANIFKSNVMNLFERLTIFDKKIDSYLNTIENQLDDLTNHSNQIANKIECDNLDCDVFFIEKQDNLELRTYNLIFELFEFKSQLVQYLQSTIKKV